MLYMLLHPAEMAHSAVNELGEQYERDIALMHNVVDDVVRQRLESGDNHTDDLLGRMLNTADKDTGQRLDPENVRKIGRAHV